MRCLPAGVQPLLRIATDGSSGRDGSGGWAWVDEHGNYDDGTGWKTTNQAMELMAVRRAVESAPSHAGIEIISDSAYVVNCMNDGWWLGWTRNGWVSSSGRPVANQKLWRGLLMALALREGATVFTHVRGHQGHPLNEQADKLATAARQRLLRGG